MIYSQYKIEQQYLDHYLVNILVYIKFSQKWCGNH